MPQGSYLGPLIFLILINDLTAGCLLHKFMDDTTVTEINHKDCVSSMDVILGQIIKWSKTNEMNINCDKTKEMILGTATVQPPALYVDSNYVERVQAFNLLGVIVDSSLKWGNHVDYICSKASSRLYWLKLLKRNSVSTTDLWHFYITAIRPVQWRSQDFCLEVLYA